MNLKIVFTDKEITPWSGMIFMKKLLDQTGILSKLISIDKPIFNESLQQKPKPMNIPG